MSNKTVPGSGAILKPEFDDNYSVSKIIVIDGGNGYDQNDPPKIEILGTKKPFVEGLFYPIIEMDNGSIVKVMILDKGLGYFPDTIGEVGITTTTESESSKDVIIKVGGGVGGAIYEKGYDVAISTSISGISSSVEPDFSGQQSIFWAFNEPHIPVSFTSGSGVDAKFSVFIVYNSTTGQPISTSIILRDGGRGYSIGDTVSIAGTYIGGTTPDNDLSFIVSKVSSTKILSEANQIYENIPGSTVIGFGSGAVFSVFRDNDGAISNVEVTYGGYDYGLSDNISIAGTYIGGDTPADNLFVKPIELAVDKLPRVLYIQKLSNNTFKVAGLSTGGILDLTSLGVGTHSFTLTDPNVNSIITIDNIIQTPIYKKTLTLALNKKVEYTDTIIYLRNGANSLSLNDIININDEYFSIKNIGIDGENSLLVEREILGTERSVHELADPVNIVYGNYNIIGDTIHFSSAPFGPTGLPGLEVGSSFDGRAFSRRFDAFIPEDKNLLFDDISDQFTGIAATEFVLKSDGVNVSGIFTNTNSITGSSSGVDVNNNPLILVNNIPQIGGTDYIIDTPGQNTIKFISGVPIAGKITKVGFTTGFAYLPLVGASATVSVSPEGTLSDIYLTGFGKGYKEAPLVTIASTVGSGASVVATIGTSGTVTSLEIINPGFGYTSIILPEVRIDLPQNHYNLSLEYASGYSGVGTGAKGSVIVGNASNIISFELDNPGVGYNVGDVLVAPGIKTEPNISNFEEFKITVLETFTDSFAGWYPGQFIQFDDISEFFNGVKKKFTLTVTTFGERQVLSLKANPEDVNIINNLFVFINDILQVPNESYTFTGTRITFSEAPKVGSKCNILFFKGSDLDVEQVDPPRTIKEGDSVLINENIFDPLDRPQFERIVQNIVATDILDTFPYDSLGISTNQTKLRPLDWTKQTQDRVINGVLYSKSRPSLKSRIIPTANVIKDINIADEKIYVDSVIPLFEDIDENRTLNEELRDVIVVNNREIEQSIIKTNVSTASTISSINIIDSGKGYQKVKNPFVSISSRFITRKDPIYVWNLTAGITTDADFNSVGYGTGFISVGSSGTYYLSYDGITWESGNKIDSSNKYTNVIGVNNRYITVGQNASAYRKVGLNTFSSWQKIDLLKIFINPNRPFSPPEITPSEYSSNLNKILYDADSDILTIVGDNGGVFSGVGIATLGVFERGITFENLNSVAKSPEYFVAVGNIGDIVYSLDSIEWEVIRNKPTLQNLNDIIWDGNRFIAVGNNGAIITSTNGTTWTLVNVNGFAKNISKISYNNNLYTILDNSGKLYFSLNLQDWVYRDINTDYSIFDIISVGSGDSEKYVAVGSSGFISYSTPEFNKAVAISTTNNETLEKVDILNGGFGYSTEISTPAIVESDVCEKEQIYSIKAKGDYGKIIDIKVYDTGNVGFGTTSPAIEFILKSENYSPILPTIDYTEISAGDYFIINNSNVLCGHALTGITTSFGGMSNYPTSKVGTAITFIDGVYKVEYATQNSLGISTVRCIFVPISANGADRIQIVTGINTTGFYGDYSFGIIYDYQNRAREIPKSFVVNKDNGLVGLNTGPVVYRTRGLI